MSAVSLWVKPARYKGGGGKETVVRAGAEWVRSVKEAKLATTLDEERIADLQELCDETKGSPLTRPTRKGAHQLLGQRFGKLIVEEQVERPDLKSRGTYWLCRCDCGAEQIATGSLLVRGLTACCRKCGYKQQSESIKATWANGAFVRASTAAQLTGKRFHRWLVVERRASRRKGTGVAAYWLCRCDCGVEREVSTKSLMAGSSRSCGCLLREVSGARMVQRNQLRLGERLERPTFADSTLAVLREHPGASYAELQRLLDLGKHATWQRLARLLACGLVRREEGDLVRWFAAEPQDQHGSLHP